MLDSTLSTELTRATFEAKQTSFGAQKYLIIFVDCYEALQIFQVILNWFYAPYLCARALFVPDNALTC
jgi:hypothetical protein